MISETSAFGAAIVAAMAIGLIDRPENFGSVTQIKETIRPQVNNHKIYNSLIQRYQTLIGLFANNIATKQGGGNAREQ
jgi:glycerol kinase